MLLCFGMLGDELMNKRIISKLKSLTGHSDVRLTNCGNSAIFIAVNIIKNLGRKNPLILIPDQGGWYSFKAYPELLSMKVKEIETDKGVLIPEVVRSETKNATALIVASFAGYYAEQPIDIINKICKENNCLLVEDVTGSITCDKMRFDSDIKVCSFGEDKLINNGYGGFISVKNPVWFTKAKEGLSLAKFDEGVYSRLYPDLGDRRIKFLFELSNNVKKDLKQFKIFHPKKQGINVITEIHPLIIDYCKEKRYFYIKCPNYIKVNEPALSIELMRVK